jgi:hypothetical protein
MASPATATCSASSPRRSARSRRLLSGTSRRRAIIAPDRPEDLDRAKPMLEQSDEVAGRLCAEGITREVAESGAALVATSREPKQSHCWFARDSERLGEGRSRCRIGRILMPQADRTETSAFHGGRRRLRRAPLDARRSSGPRATAVVDWAPGFHRGMSAEVVSRPPLPDLTTRTLGESVGMPGDAKPASHLVG